MKVTNNKFDVIILSLAVNDETYKTTSNCIDSYINTADELINNIFVIETNSNFDMSYSNKKTKIIKPNKQFNYNEFFNIGLNLCTSEYIIGPNNDLTIEPGCMQTIYNEFETNEKISSISPIDRNWHRHKKMYLPSDNKLYYGYEVSLHMFGCLFACRRSIFRQIGLLDEKFYFFYQDNDYVMSLERCGLLHGVHTGARIKHCSGHSDKFAEDRLKYTPKNMHVQEKLFKEKWLTQEPFKSGGFSKYKIYNF